MSTVSTSKRQVIKKVRYPQPNLTSIDILLDSIHQPSSIIDIIVGYTGNKQCMHKCELTHIALCCACTDSRPYYIVREAIDMESDDNPLYNDNSIKYRVVEYVKQYLYMDGRNYKKVVHHRATFYCQSCKQRYNHPRHITPADDTTHRIASNYMLKHKRAPTNNTNTIDQFGKETHDPLMLFSKAVLSD